MPVPRQKPDKLISPDELFAFLSRHDDYPVSGLRLAQAAREDEASPELAEFFEALPGTLNAETEIVAHAVKPTEAPFDAALAVPDGEPTPPFIPPQQATLQVDDILAPKSDDSSEV
jgi:hypothetical protein